MTKKKTGRMVWTPGYVLRELDKIMEEQKIDKRSHAWEIASHHMKVGREVNRIVEPKTGGVKKKPKWRGLFGEEWY